MLAGNDPLNESGGLSRRVLELECNLLDHCMVSYKFPRNGCLPCRATNHYRVQRLSHVRTTTEVDNAAAPWTSPLKLANSKAGRLRIGDYGARMPKRPSIDAVLLRHSVGHERGSTLSVGARVGYTRKGYSRSILKGVWSKGCVYWHIERRCVANQATSPTWLEEFA